MASFGNAIVGILKNFNLEEVPLSLNLRFSWNGSMTKDLLALLDAIHQPLCRPEYAPSAGITHCNGYVTEVCEIYGFKGLRGLLANQIIDLIQKHEQWTEISVEKSQNAANNGTLILAALKADLHGHVSIVCPGKAKTSGRWGEVPSLANVGKEVSIGRGLNWSFSEYPTLYAWRPSL